MDKWLRNYRFEISTREGGTLVIEPPFTVEFDVTRNVLSSANSAQFRIYNLSEKNREQLRKDPYDGTVVRPIIFKAGYGDKITQIFKGNISTASSVREHVNFITTIECYDASFAFVNAQTNREFPPGTPKAAILKSFMDDLTNYDVKAGAVGLYIGNLSRRTVFSGSTIELLKTYSGGGFFIDGEKAHCLGDEEAVVGELQIIDSASGLLGTPIRNDTYLNFDMIFEPRLLIGQAIVLASLTNKNFNGLHKIVSLHHRGTISQAVCGEAITSVGMFIGNIAPVGVA